MVAACARTNGKTPISPERREKGATVASAALFKDYNQNDEANLKFAEHFAGASIVVHGRDTEKVQATIKLMFDNHDPVIVRGMIPFGKENHAVEMPNADQNAKTDITVQAGCGGSDCQIVSAQVTLKQEVDEATAQELTGAKAQADLSAMSKAADGAVATAPAGSASDVAGAAAESTAGATPEAMSESKTDVKKVTVIQRNVIAFTILTAPSKEETLVQKNQRLSKMGLILSGRTAKGPGSLKSFEEAFRAITGEDAPADEQVEVLTASPVKTEDAAADASSAQPVSSDDATDDQAGDDSSKEAAATAVKPAAASTSTATAGAAEQKAADTKTDVKADAKAAATEAKSTSAEAKPASTQQQASSKATATAAKPAAATTKSTAAKPVATTASK
jgi:hypothetical protein